MPSVATHLLRLTQRFPARSASSYKTRMQFFGQFNVGRLLPTRLDAPRRLSMSDTMTTSAPLPLIMAKYGSHSIAIPRPVVLPYLLEDKPFVSDESFSRIIFNRVVNKPLCNTARYVELFKLRLSVHKKQEVHHRSQSAWTEGYDRGSASIVEGYIRDCYRSACDVSSDRRR